MKRLFALRHAKSSWDDPGVRDFDRPLNPRGQEAAGAVGAYLKGRGQAFDLVLASPAARVRQTIDLLGEAYGTPFDAVFRHPIYNASIEALLKELRSIDGRVENVLLVGHNPGLQELIVKLADAKSGRVAAAVGNAFPTGALAQLDLPGRWDQLRSDSCRLVEFIRPRDLPASQS